MWLVEEQFAMTEQTINKLQWICHLAKYRTLHNVWLDALVNISKNCHVLFLYQPFASESSDFIVAYMHIKINPREKRGLMG